MAALRIPTPITAGFSVSMPPISSSRPNMSSTRRQTPPSRLWRQRRVKARCGWVETDCALMPTPIFTLKRPTAVLAPIRTAGITRIVSSSFPPPTDWRWPIILLRTTRLSLRMATRTWDRAGPICCRIRWEARRIRTSSWGRARKEPSTSWIATTWDISMPPTTAKSCRKCLGPSAAPSARRPTFNTRFIIKARAT
jgi:hypothetical protein